MDFAEAVTKAKNAIKQAEQNERDKKGMKAIHDLNKAISYLEEAVMNLRKEVKK